MTTKKIPIERLQNFEDYPPSKRTQAKARLEALRPLIEEGPSLSRLQMAADTLGVSNITAGRLLDRYILSGQRISALIPRAFSFGLSNRRLSRQQKDLLDRVLREFYLQPERPSQKQTVDHVQRACRNEGIKRIGGSSIIRAIKCLPMSEATAQRIGVKAARETFRAHRGKAPSGDRPLALVEVDHTSTDVFVLLPNGKTYRPWITIAIDTFTRMVLGFYLTREAPSQLSVGLCLYRAMTHKAEWLRRHGITADWPCFGQWQTVVTDNAKEFRGYYLQEVGLEHNLNISFRGVGSPNWGAHIERLMGHAAREMHMLPGTCFSNPLERGEYDPSVHAVLTLEQLEKIFLHLFVEVYHCSSHRGLGGRSPLSVWNDYFSGSDVPAVPHFPQVHAGQDLLTSLLPHFCRKIQQDGVSWEGNLYFDMVLLPYIRQNNPKRHDGLWRFHYDPRDIRQVWFKDPATGGWFPIPLRDASADGVALWDLKAYQAEESQIAAATIDQQAIDRGRNAIDAIVQDAQSLKEHRQKRRRSKTKQKTTKGSNTETAEIRIPTPDLISWLPAQETNPSIWDEQGVFVVETVETDLRIGGPRAGEHR